jgi:Methyltransferase domain
MRPCPACLQTQSQLIGELQNTFQGSLSRSAYDLVHCKSCDIVYLSPLPLASDLDTMYSALQFDYHSEESVGPIMEFYTNRVRALRGALGSDTGGHKPFSVLEIGAGPAWVTRAAKSVQADSLTVAQDVSPEMAQKCPWVDHYIVESTDAKALDQWGPYDVISLTHVIEHVPDPVATLRRAGDLSRGLIFITAPHRPVAWKGTIEEWRTYSYNHVPAHLQYFSEQGMVETAQRAGLQVIHWDASAEEGQAFEAWLGRPETPVNRTGLRMTRLRSILSSLAKPLLGG